MQVLIRIRVRSGMECYAGMIWADEPFEGYICVDNGIVSEIGRGKAPEGAHFSRFIIPPMVDAHTHLGDAGLDLKGAKYSLEELVAPPNGLKHRYLRSTPREKIVDDMKVYCRSLKASGVSRVMDFREGGLEGVRMLREACPDAVILGRPVSEGFDANEIDAILREADGIGISSISDMPVAYVEAIADAVHRAGKILAIHVSERVREDMDTVLSLQPDFVVHMCMGTDRDLRALADADVPISVCTRSNLYFGRVPPLKRMCDAGADIMIGTDNAMLFPPDIMGEMDVFQQLCEQQGCHPSTLPRASARSSKLLSQGVILGVAVGDAVAAVPGDTVTVVGRTC